eukprot:CAMPEP_0195595338 /NCGR_PEP_ID=MMETSP0815-20121206/1885_1 /TAXON_ID=97485 /ORGANISM="Prymnesium parvum, Strain Texoma1" /LENGTH=138 /DNA_ID=CAMNT_0040734579 /DNA_START=99 /DNA_END=512 /DNA_ORIENTATION=+
MLGDLDGEGFLPRLPKNRPEATTLTLGCPKVEVEALLKEARRIAAPHEPLILKLLQPLHPALLASRERKNARLVDQILIPTVRVPRGGARRERRKRICHQHRRQVGQSGCRTDEEQPASGRPARTELGAANRLSDGGG